nr:uncharacterized protein LOC126056809 [Helicoverpa armigera]
MSNYAPYRWCVVSECENTSVKTPDKLWIQVPVDINMRNTWLKVARRDPGLLSDKSRLYFCEDHFDLEHDMENYIRYKIMGSVKRIKMKPNCIPSRFAWNRKHKILKESHPTEAKRQRVALPEDSYHDYKEAENNEVSSYTEGSCTPSVAGSTVEQDYSPSKTSMSKTTSDSSLQDEHKKLQKINLQSTISKIIDKPKLYIGINKNLYFIIDLIKKHTDITVPNILLCLMKIKLNRTFSQYQMISIYL